MLNAIEKDGASLVKAVQSGATTARESSVGFLHTINASETLVHAFAHRNDETVLQRAETIDRDARKGRLAGLPIGVKDNFDTMDFPTEYNSPIYRGHRPSRDCAVVARLKAAGAVIIGKTETTEFAFMHTGPTCNPHGLEHTPGSSSAGSAAGMAAGFFPLALGTQTAGSLIKPASYCGAFAFKPTFGRISLEGVKPLASSLDTVGWFGRSIADLRLMADVLLDGRSQPAVSPQRPLRLLIARTDFWEGAEESAKNVLEKAVEVLRSAGHDVAIAHTPFDYQKLAEAHKVVNDTEGARSFAYEYENYPGLLSDAMLQMIQSAHHFNEREENNAKQYIFSKALEMDSFMSDVDAIITLSTAYEAPKGLASTGTSDFIKTWHALGMPQINIPYSCGKNGMPIGLQIVGARGYDFPLLDIARAIAKNLGVEQSMVVDLKR
jgi:Asp-tRNA(Asn)/Glu-tRNA(Gln) amidotransferase A subunit family amidase